MNPADSWYGTTDAAGGFQAAVPSVLQSSIRKGVAFAGAGTALLAGVAGLIGQFLFYSSYNSAFYLFGPATYILLVAAAIAALVQINRLPIIGLLQGMWWPAVTLVATDAVRFSVYHASGLTGRFLAGYWATVTSDVLGAAAAILLVISWSPAVDSRRSSRLGPLQVMLLCGVGLSQIATGIFYATPAKQATSYTLAIAGLLVGLAVTWYAVNLRIAALGGALVLGWATVTALNLLSFTLAWTASGVLGCVLLAVVMILAFIYMRTPSALAPSRSASDP